MKIPENIKKLAKKLSDALVVQVEDENGEKRLLTADEFFAAPVKLSPVKLYCSVAADDISVFCEFREWFDTGEWNKKET